ncbi:zinc finger MYND domain-containing protein 12 isoform X2 [Ornithorhynchus anatinus]|uniref:Zinc finger MYND-type containing 12 n=1 Tax=Ornithorhynchus anatinus TaxID=9258 RepID=F6ZUR8_ORNAN|nr:zinc finger MYND domain-containing protein 12 isoform X2 [Ornithorhynchus anatinus]
MNPIYPLALPKGRKLRCEVCEAPAERVCQGCMVTYYCDVEHQQVDWVSIHEKICQLLIPLRTSLPFFNSEEERKHGMEQLCLRQKHLIELTHKVAQKFLFEGKYEEALPAALHSLRFSINVHGLNSVELVPSYLLLAEANIGLSRIIQAEEFLSKAQWTILKSPECSDAILSKLHRNFGFLCVAKRNDDESLYHFANDIYYASCAYGTENINTSGEYFYMANVFYRQNKMDVADSLYAKVIEIWRKHLDKLIQFQLDSIKSSANILESEMEPNEGYLGFLRCRTSLWEMELCTDSERAVKSHSHRRNPSPADAKWRIKKQILFGEYLWLSNSQSPALMG